ncbi:MAG: hypothetical protein GY754_19600 [bacterium]|nr:hypothetical protein [bacterium]
MHKILKIRSCIFFVVLIYSIQLLLFRSFFINAFVLNRVYYFLDLQHSLFSLRSGNEIIDRFFFNCITVLEGRYEISWPALSFLFFLLVIPFLLYIQPNSGILKRVQKVVLIAAVVVLGGYACLLNDPLFFSIMTVVGSIFVFFNFLLFNNNTIFKQDPPGLFWGIFFAITIGFTEFICFPLYLKYRDSLFVNNFYKKYGIYFRNMYYCLMLVFVYLLVAPQNVEKYHALNRLVNGDIYGLRLSQKESKLYYWKHSIEEDCFVYRIDLPGNTKEQLVYPQTKMGANLSLSIDIDEKKDELYIVNREEYALLIIDPVTLNVKGRIFNEKFDNGDIKIIHTDNYFYLLDENNIEIIKIERSGNKVVKERVISPLSLAHTGFVYSPKKNVLYLTNWYNHNDPRGYFLWEVDANTLLVKRKISFPGAVFGFCVSGSKIYCSVLNGRFLYVVDANSFTIEEKIKVAIAPRGVAVDEDRRLLFVGSALSNTIDVIDLDTKKRRYMFKAGCCSLREIVLDKKRCNIYVSSRAVGLHMGSYKNLLNE